MARMSHSERPSLGSSSARADETILRRCSKIFITRLGSSVCRALDYAPSGLRAGRPQSTTRNRTPSSINDSRERIRMPDSDQLTAQQADTPPFVEDVSPAVWSEAILSTLRDAGDEPLTLRDVQDAVAKLVPSIGMPPVAHELEILIRYGFVRREANRAAVRLTEHGHELAAAFSSSAA